LYGSADYIIQVILYFAAIHIELLHFLLLKALRLSGIKY
jgi:hypothetical protein